MDRIDCHVRWMIRRDMPTVLAIEQQCFEFPWTEAEFKNTLRARNVLGYVAEDTSDLTETDEGNQAAVVVGYMLYCTFEKHVHLMNIAVEKASQGRGVGRQLIEKLVGKLSANRRSAVTTDVRETNVEAVKFLQAMGFRYKETLRGVYCDTDEDAYRLVYALPSEVTA